MDNPENTEQHDGNQNIDYNVYSDSISQWYDEIMEAGYYDHKRIADGLAEDLQGKERVLELGVGTGLLAEQMAKRGFKVTGIDFTESMLEKAQQRLGDVVKLYKQNVVRLDLPEKYEAVYSEGGVWYFTRGEDGNLFLESHLTSLDDNIRAMKMVSSHLESGGLLILGIQPVHADLESLTLKNGAVYSQKVAYKLPFVDKEYFVKQDNQIVAHQRSTFMRLSDKERAQLIEKASMEEIGIDRTNQFVIFRKK